MPDMRRAWGIAASACTCIVLGAVGCTAGADASDAGPGSGGGADGASIDAASSDASSDAPDTAIDAMPADVTVTESTSLGVAANKSAACGVDDDGSSYTPIITAENSYYRVFDLPALGVPGQLTIEHVDFGVQNAAAVDGSQTVQLRLSTLSGGFQIGNLTPRGQQDVVIVDQVQTLVGVTLAPPVVIPAGSQLVVEIFVPDSTLAGSGERNVFFVGANASTESAPSYARAPSCGVPQPTTFAALAYPDTHVVMQVSGTTP